MKRGLHNYDGCVRTDAATVPSQGAEAGKPFAQLGRGVTTGSVDEIVPQLAELKEAVRASLVDRPESFYGLCSLWSSVAVAWVVDTLSRATPRQCSAGGWDRLT